MWDRDDHRLALLALLDTGTLRRRTTNADAYDELSLLGWARRTRRRDELELEPHRRVDIERLLSRVWPDWSDVLARLHHHALPVDTSGLQRLREIERPAALPESLPAQLNQRVASAALAPHSKARLRDEHLSRLADVAITHDGLVRLRPSPGLIVRRGNEAHDAQALSALLGELMLTERALRGGTRIEGKRPRALLTVENVGAYVELTPPAGFCVVHVPGWDTSSAALLLESFADVPVVHFGDLDPNGLRITTHLRTLHPDVRWAVPDFWSEHLEGRARPCTWPNLLVPNGAPELLKTLAARGLMLEQEPLVLDARLTAALEALITPEHL